VSLEDDTYKCHLAAKHLFSRRCRASEVEAETIIGLFSKNETLTQGLSSARERAGEAGRGCVGGSPKLDAQEAATKRPADERPRNPSGKVLKRQLRKPYWEAKRRRIN